MCSVRYRHCCAIRTRCAVVVLSLLVAVRSTVDDEKLKRMLALFIRIEFSVYLFKLWHFGMFFHFFRMTYKTKKYGNAQEANENNNTNDSESKKKKEKKDKCDVIPMKMSADIWKQDEYYYIWANMLHILNKYFFNYHSLKSLNYVQMCSQKFDPQEGTRANDANRYFFIRQNKTCENKIIIIKRVSVQHFSLWNFHWKFIVCVAFGNLHFY